MKKVFVYFMLFSVFTFLVGCDLVSSNNVDDSNEPTIHPEGMEGNLHEVSGWTTTQELHCEGVLVKKVVNKTVLNEGKAFYETMYHGYSNEDQIFLKTQSGGVYYEDQMGEYIRFEGSDFLLDYYQYIVTLQGEHTVYQHDEINKIFSFEAKIDKFFQMLFDIKSVDGKVEGELEYDFYLKDGDVENGEKVPIPSYFEMILTNVEFNNVFNVESDTYETCEFSMYFEDIGTTIVQNIPYDYREEEYVNLGSLLTSAKYYDEFVENQYIEDHEDSDEFGVFYNDDYVFTEIGDTDYIYIYIENETMFGSYLNGTSEIRIYDENNVELYYFTHAKNSTYGFTYTLAPGRYVIEIIPLNMAIGDYLGLNVINLTPPEHGQYVFLLGDFNMDILLGEEFIDPGYLIIQTTTVVTVTNNINANVIGQYTVLYEWDYFDEVHSFTRTVNVISND